LGRKKLFEKRISADEMERKTKEYQAFVLKDIFSEYELKEYMDGIKNILQKNGESEGFGDFGQDGNSWFYTNGNLYNFLEEDNCIKDDIKDEDNLKKQSCLNLGNSERINPKCEVFKWTNSHDEGLQISLRNSPLNSNLFDQP